MTKRVSVKDARAHFSELLGEVRYGAEPIIVEKKGRPMAVLISPEQWDRYKAQSRERFFGVVDTIQARNAGQDPEGVEQVIAACVEEVRRERHASR